MDLDKLREQKFEFVRMLLINACVCGKFRFLIGMETFYTTKVNGNEHNAVVSTINLLDGHLIDLEKLAEQYDFKVKILNRGKDLEFIYKGAK